MRERPVESQSRKARFEVLQNPTAQSGGNSSMKVTLLGWFSKSRMEFGIALD